MNLVRKVLNSRDFNDKEKVYILSKINEDEGIDEISRIPVESSNIVSIGYSTKDSVLEIEFKSGGTYRYNGVPQLTYDDLMDAESHGSFFHQHIKGGNYEYEKQ